jgi:DDE superfamily endonuclease
VVLKRWPLGRLHLILDNLSAHTSLPVATWTKQHRRRVQFHRLLTNGTWVNLIESYFETLQRTALHNTNFTTAAEIENGLQRGIAYLNKNHKPYRWRKIKRYLYVMLRAYPTSADPYLEKRGSARSAGKRPRAIIW